MSLGLLLFAAGINFLLFGLIANMVVKTGQKHDERLHEVAVFPGESL
jgi:hypothetical protein